MSLEQVADHNDSSEDDCEVNDSRERKISKDYANEMHIEQDFEMDDSIDYQESGPDRIVDDADIAKGLHMLAERTKRSLNCKVRSTKA